MHYLDRKSFKVGLLGAIVGGTLVFFLWLGNAVYRSESWVKNNQIENQISQEIQYVKNLKNSCGVEKPSKKEASLSNWLLGSGEAPKSICSTLPKGLNCIDSLQKLLGSSGVVTKLSSDKRRQVLALTDCYFIEPTLSKGIRWEGISISEIGLISVIDGFLIGFVILVMQWILRYPHIGWRRIFIVSAGIAGICVGSHSFLSGKSFIESSIIMVATALICGILLPIFREIFLWVKAGFDHAK
jgi:hypothetical protein